MANDYYGMHDDDGFDVWGNKTESDREVYEVGKPGDPSKRSRKIVAIGEKSLDVLDAATEYRRQNGAVVRIMKKENCHVCGRTLTVRCPAGVFADFYTLHMKCNRSYYEENGCPPKGVGMMFVGEEGEQVAVFGRAEMMYELMKATPPEMLGEVKHTFRP